MSETEGRPYRELHLPDGRFIYVHQDAYPQVMEWDWHHDDATEQVVRVENGKKVYLFNELARRFRRSGEEVPHLTRAAVRVLFGHNDSYREALLLSALQRETALEEGVMTPGVHEVLVQCLALALRDYFNWRDQKQELAFNEDPERLVPGEFVLVPVPAGRTYGTLGEWLQTTLTGDYVPMVDTPFGMIPETRDDAIMPEFRRIWRRLLRQANFGKVNVKKVQKLLRSEERSAADLIDWIYEVIATYPLPE